MKAAEHGHANPKSQTRPDLTKQTGKSLDNYCCHKPVSDGNNSSKPEPRQKQPGTIQEPFREDWIVPGGP